MWMSGSLESCSMVSPPQPNHKPPVRLSALRMPIASPPGAADLRGSEIRFETHTSRLILRVSANRHGRHAVEGNPYTLKIVPWGARSDGLAVAAHPDRGGNQGGRDDEADPQPWIGEEANRIQSVENIAGHRMDATDDDIRVVRAREERCHYAVAQPVSEHVRDVVRADGHALEQHHRERRKH